MHSDRTCCVFKFSNAFLSGPLIFPTEEIPNSLELFIKYVLTLIKLAFIAKMASALCIVGVSTLSNYSYAVGLCHEIYFDYFDKNLQF